MGSEYPVDFLPKSMIETVVAKDVAKNTVATILKTANKGKIGDGKVFVLPIESAVRIRTEETDSEAP